MNRKQPIFFITLILFTIISVAGVSAASIYVPNFDLIARGYMDEGLFKFSTKGDIELLIQGGYKFGGYISLGFNSMNLQYSTNDTLDAETDSLSSVVNYLNSKTFITFKSAGVILRDFMDIPLDFQFFIGLSDNYCSGNDFPELFGTDVISSRFGSYLYFPDSVIYDGIYSAIGTGVKLSSNFTSDWNYTALYIYEDSLLGDGIYSFDLRSLFNVDFFKGELFFGASVPYSTMGVYRMGLMFLFEAGDVGEFMTQIGIPKWDPAADDFTIDLFYFLFEPRVKVDFFQLVLTLFWHPAFYNGVSTDELGSIDINLDLYFGKPEEIPVSGGLETYVGMNTYEINEFSVIVSPYLSALTSGVVWDIKLNWKVFPWDTTDMFELFIGVNAEF